MTLAAQSLEEDEVSPLELFFDLVFVFAFSQLSHHLRRPRNLDIRSHAPEGVAMSAWTNDELTRIGTADELELASARPDGTLRSPRTIWVVRVGDDLYVRSMNGRDDGWFPATQVRHQGHVRAGGVDKDVTFADAHPDLNDQIDAAYHDKYRRYGERIIGGVVNPGARAATIRLVPAEDEHDTA